MAMDIVIPEPDSFECIRRIRKYNPLAKFIMITTLDQKARILKSLMIGVRDFIIKQYKSHKIVTTVERVTQNLNHTIISDPI
ncbi:MAG: response regulator [Candidatus Hodarchaeota archaeon]